MAFDPDNLEIYRSPEQEIPLGHIVNQGDFNQKQSNASDTPVLEMANISFPQGNDTVATTESLLRAVRVAFDSDRFVPDDRTRAVEAVLDHGVANFVIQSAKRT